MSSMTNYFEKALRSTREKSSADIVCMIVIFLGVVAILLILAPPLK